MSHATAPIPVLPFTSSLLSCSEQSFGAAPMDTADIGDVLILQSFHLFTYVTAHSPTLPLLHLRHSSFSNPSAASPTSQLILQLFRCFTYITAHSPILPSLQLLHSSFYNLSVASLKSQTFHLRHLASRPCFFESFSSI